MKIVINEKCNWLNPHQDESIKVFLKRLYRVEIKGYDFNEPVYLIATEETEIPKECESFTLFDMHCVNGVLSFRNIHEALSALEIIASPSVQSLIYPMIKNGDHLADSIDEHFGIFKPLFLSCGILLNSNGKNG